MIQLSDKILAASQLTKPKNTKYPCGHSVPIENLVFDVKTQKIIILSGCLFCEPHDITDKFSNSNYSGYKPISTPSNTFEQIKLPYTFGLELECFVDLQTINELNNSYVWSKGSELYDVKKILKSLSKSDSNLKPLNNVARITLPQDEINKTLKQWYCGYDCSVRTSAKNKRPFELRSHILCGDKGLESVNNLMKIVKPTFNNTTGLHIHIKPDYDHTSAENAKKIMLISMIYDVFFFYWKVNLNRRRNSFTFIRLLDLSQSGLEKICYYFKTTNVEHTIGVDQPEDTSICTCCASFLPTADCQDNWRAIRADYNYMYQHYSSTSFNGLNTVEFRLMHGNKNLNYIKEMINYYMAVLKLATKSEAEIKDSLLSCLGLPSDGAESRFKKLVNKTKNTNQQDDELKLISTKLGVLLNSVL